MCFRHDKYFYKFGLLYFIYSYLHTLSTRFYYYIVFLIQMQI